jgi:TonB-linked SusC/RagA family outer membrane protein
MKKSLLIMRLSIFFLFISMLQVSAAGYSQASKLSVSLNNASLSEVLDNIESKSEFKFLYRKDYLNLKIKIDVNAKNQKVEDLLDDILSNYDNLSYSILKDNLIVIAPINIAQEITGTVSDTDGNPVPGATVSVKGTSLGTITDMDGKYSITANEGATLIFSFVGMETKEVTVGSSSVINVTLETSDVAIDDVVVTALGISREKKALGYSVAEVEGDELRVVPQENVVNALNGRVSGVQINNTGGAGSSVKIIIRGASSLTTDNQPLFVVDGVPISSGLTNVGNVGSGVAVDYGNAIADLNPDDIESISVLKGPSAAALYGTRAGNGVVLITTKSGKKSKGFGVSFSTNTVFEKPYKFFEPWTNKFANGYRPDPNATIDETSIGGVGPMLDVGNTAIQWPFTAEELASGIPIVRPLISKGKDNAKNFFETAITSTNTVSIQNSSDKLDYRLSYTNMQHKGFIPNSDLHRNNLSLNTSYKIMENLKLSSSINFANSGAKNRPSTADRNANPLQAVYSINPRIDIRDMQNYWLVPGKTQNAPYNWGSSPEDFEFNNPYFMAYEINNGFSRTRVFGNVRADWSITDNFSAMVRYNLNNSNEIRETKISSGFDRERNGAYGLVNSGGTESNADFLLSYNGPSGGDLSYNVSFGGNIMKQNNLNSYAQTKNGGAGLILPNVFSISNIAEDNLASGSSKYKKQINSLYALGSIGYKEMIYVDVTARNDWSSTLPEDNNSFFYPSVSASLLINNMVDLGDKVSLLKLRAGWAQVGNDTSPYRLYNTLGKSVDWGSASQLNVSSGLLNPNLKPEINTSVEFGTDIALFQNRLHMDFTYYTSDNENQILSVNAPISSGYTSKLINAGLLRSKGIEASIGGTPVQTANLKWDVNFVYSTNTTTIEELVDGTDYIRFWGEAKGGAYTWVGEEVGNIIDRAFVRVDDPNSPYNGWPLLDDEGWENDDRTLSDEDGNRVAPIIGNYNPDFKLGFQTSVSYKSWNFSMNLDWRKGGQFVSQTSRYFESDLTTQRWLDKVYDLSDVGDIEAYIREHADEFLLPGGEFYPLVGGPTAELGGFPYDGLNDGVFLPGVIGHYDADGNFVMEQENIGGAGTQYHSYGDNYPWSFTKASTFDADYIKIRDVSISYSFSSAIAQKMGMQNLSIAVFSRNIILWTKAGINIDPESAFQYSNGSLSQGVERYNIQPWSIPVGFKLNIGF